jgi:DNA-binding transcriptional ArsR family regulator
MEGRVSIVITPDGACLLSGDRDNLVMDQIFRKDATLSRIVRNTGLPKSTVFSILNKLTSDGIVDSYSDEDGMRWYRATSVRAINLHKPMIMPDIMERRWNRHASRGSLETIPKICYMALMSAPESSGVDTSPLYLNLGRELR